MTKRPRTIENEAHFTNTSCKLFCGFSFSCSNRSFWCSSIAIMHRHEYGSEAFVCKRCDHEPLLIANVLIAKSHSRVDARYR